MQFGVVIIEERLRRRLEHIPCSIRSLVFRRIVTRLPDLDNAIDAVNLRHCQ
jgi:hypothetical protein